MNHNMSAQGGSALGRKYFFILGTNPTLSLAELAAVFYNLGKLSLIQTNIAILETDQEIKANIIKNIGGTIKFGLIYDETNSHNTGDVLSAIARFAKPKKASTKFMFGISSYGKNKIHPVKSRMAGIPPQAELFHGVNIKALAMEFKKTLKQSGVNSRWVTSREPTLSSVVAEQNKLTTNRGVEIVIIQFNKSSTIHGKVLDKKLLLGKTLAVQPFKEFSFRDYGRPARDDRSGMLPPKLAQIMINLALAPSPYKGEGRGEVILDPFCGSGTIITEAMLMGYKNIIGADISERAIGDTKQNIEWTQKNYELQITNYKLFNVNATEISKKIMLNSIDAIITEPYLGPQRGLFNIGGIVRELEQLYSKSLVEFKKILKPGGRIVMIWPVFLPPLSLRGPSSSLRNWGWRRSNLININPDLSGFKIINPIPENLQNNIFVKLTNRQTIIYGREQQKVWREIVVLEK